MTRVEPWVEALVYLYLLNPSKVIVDDNVVAMLKPIPYLGVALKPDDYDHASGNHPIRPMLLDYCMSCGTDYGAIPNGRLVWNCPACNSMHYMNDKHCNLTILSSSLGMTDGMLSWIALNLLEKRGSYEASINDSTSLSGDVLGLD